jgi:hypothetical protein
MGNDGGFMDIITRKEAKARGEMLTYVHMGFGSVFEEDLLLDVRMGVVVAAPCVTTEARRTTRKASAGRTFRAPTLQRRA